jgi:hypothetical protein
MNNPNPQNAFRLAEDQCNKVDCLLGLNPYAIYVLTIENDEVSFDDPTNIRVVNPPQRIVLADGYLPSAPYDGYLNPRVVQTSSSVSVLAGGQLSANYISIGPLCYPYTNGYGLSGGYDPLSTFQASTTLPGQNNLQVWLQIVGIGLSSTANSFYRVISIRLSGKGIQEGVSYKVIAESTGTNISALQY